MTDIYEEPRTSETSSNREFVHHDWREAGTATGGVIDAIVAVTGTPATELDPLHETIDPDALDRILGAGSGSPARRSNIAVSFSHESCDVTVRADGQVTVRLQTDGL